MCGKLEAVEASLRKTKWDNKVDTQQQQQQPQQPQSWQKQFDFDLL